MNERLLRDGCEAVGLLGGLAGEPSSQAVRLWLEFSARPTGRNWYRAHNASIVGGYLEHRKLAEAESAPERFFMNVALVRVLYAHALVGAPSLALGRLRSARPRARRPSVRDGRRVPLTRGVCARPLPAGARSGALRRRRAPTWPDARLRGDRASAATPVRVVGADLDEPRLVELIRDGNPIYAWPFEQRHVWRSPNMPLAARVLERVTRAR